MITWPPASIVSVPRNCLRMASSVSTATMSVPSIATAPFSMTRRGAVHGDDRAVVDDERHLPRRCWAARTAGQARKRSSETPARIPEFYRVGRMRRGRAISPRRPPAGARCAGRAPRRAHAAARLPRRGAPYQPDRRGRGPARSPDRGRHRGDAARPRRRTHRAGRHRHRAGAPRRPRHGRIDPGAGAAGPRRPHRPAARRGDRRTPRATTPVCRRGSPRAWCCWPTRCWPPAAAPWRRWTSSRAPACGRSA